MKFKPVITLAAAAVLLSAGISFAANTFNVTVDQGSIANTWVYTIWNDDSTGLVPVALDLEWDTDPEDYDTSGLDAPENWSADSVYSFFYPAWSYDTTSNQPLTFGEHLTGFVVSASEKPTIWTVYLEDADGVDMGEQAGIISDNSGVTPEPGSFAALLGGLATIGGAFARKRRA